MKVKKGQRRTFSEAFKREKVKLIDSGKLTVRGVCDIYEVTPQAVYKWKEKFSSIASDEAIVVQKISEAKKTQELYGQVRDLEQALGRKQMELDYYKELVKLSSEIAGEDLEKKYKPKQ